jgi:hypothetical protein
MSLRSRSRMLSGPIFIRFVFFLALSLLFPNPADSVQLRDIWRARILLVGIRAHAVAGIRRIRKGRFCLSRHADLGCFNEKTALELACLAGIRIQHRGFPKLFPCLRKIPGEMFLGRTSCCLQREPLAQASIKRPTRREIAAISLS